MKAMTIIQAKHHLGKALAETLGIEVVTTKTGRITQNTARKLNRAGYYWFPSRRCWDRLGDKS